MIYAHIAGVPLEESLGTCGPALLTALGAVAARVRARRIRRRSPARRMTRGGRSRQTPLGGVPGGEPPER